MREGAGGAEGLELFRQQGPIDLVLLDQNMPGLLGQEVLTQLLALDPLIKVVVLSGGAVAKADFAGARAFLHKPVRSNELERVVRQVLETPSS